MNAIEAEMWMRTCDLLREIGREAPRDLKVALVRDHVVKRTKALEGQAAAYFTEMAVDLVESWEIMISREIEIESRSVALQQGTVMCPGQSTCDRELCQKSPLSFTRIRKISVYTTTGKRGAFCCTMSCPRCGSEYETGRKREKEGSWFLTDPSRGDFWLNSEKIAFEKRFLEEFSSMVVLCHMSFKGRAGVYNTMFGPGDSGSSRLDREVLAEAFFGFNISRMLYSIHGDGAEHPSGHLDSWMEKHFDILLERFEKMWYLEHSCQETGCGVVTVLDLTMKSRRAVCNARLLGKRSFSVDGKVVEIVTGCRRTPSRNSLYCSDHTELRKPIVAPIISSRDPINTRSRTRSWTRQMNGLQESASERDSDSSGEAELSDDEYYVECILDQRMGLDGQELEYLVKWEGWTEENATWEPASHLSSETIAEYCSTVNVTSSHDNMDADEDVSCQTRKDDERQGARYRSAGVATVNWPCGVVCSFMEMFKSESLTQTYLMVAGIFERHGKRESHMAICYDDGCHLARFSKKPSRVFTGETGRLLGGMDFFVDRFHFPNHVDPWCKANCDPNDARRTSWAGGINSETCEQLFSWVCGFKKSVRHMNQTRFRIFHLIIFHLHNQSKSFTLNLTHHHNIISMDSSFQ